jgi:Flp pilus assembly protein CpaB
MFSSDGLAPRLRHRLGAAIAGPSWRRLRLARQVAAAVLVGLALLLALAPRAPATTVPVTVAAAEITAGATLRSADLVVREWPAELVPAGTLRDPTSAAGRVLVGAARAGEPITDVRLVGASPPSSAAPGEAAVPVRLADVGVAALLMPGSRVDVVTIGGRTDQPVVLASGASVLAVLAADDAGKGRLVMVGMPREIATRVAAASLTEQVAVTLR